MSLKSPVEEIMSLVRTFFDWMDDPYDPEVIARMAQAFPPDASDVLEDWDLDPDLASRADELGLDLEEWEEVNAMCACWVARVRRRHDELHLRGYYPGTPLGECGLFGHMLVGKHSLPLSLIHI